MYLTGGIMAPHPPLILPQIGKGEEAGIEKTSEAYREAMRELAAPKPETVVVISPHATMYADYFHISPGTRARGDFSQFGRPEISFEVSYDEELTEAIEKAASEMGVMAGTLGEQDERLDHGVMVPLWFLNPQMEHYQLVRVGLSGLALTEHYRLGQAIRTAAERAKRKIAIIASGDLSHRLKEDGPYGYREEGPVYDKKIMEIMETADFGTLFDFSAQFRQKAAECGHGAFVILAGAFDRTAVTARRLSYQGPFGVGYGVCTFRPGKPDETRNFGERQEKREAERLAEKKSREDAYVKLARASLEHYISTGKKLSLPSELPAELMEKRAGTFVSLKKDGQLRGCIGTIGPVRDCLGAEILENAVSAGTEDPRFAPVEEEELESLEYSVDVLGEPEPVKTQEELDPLRYGVIVTKGRRRGLLLPHLEGVDTVREQLDIARQKAGIGPDEEVEIQRFEVVRHQ